MCNRVQLADLERQRQLAIDDRNKAEQESQSMQYRIGLQVCCCVAS